MNKFYTSDLHFNHGLIIEYEKRPYKSAEDMNEKIIRKCNERAKPEDTVYHIGDFSNYGNNRGVQGLKIKAVDLISQLNGNWIMLEGNHDKNNRVKSHMKGCFTMISNYRTWMSHYPSTDFYDKYNSEIPIDKSMIDVWLCGHVHGKWKSLYDDKNKILNVNVGWDVWRYQLIKESELIAFIEKEFRLIKESRK